MVHHASSSLPRLIGYARVSTEDQATHSQVDTLKAAGCHLIHEEHASGASHSRPVLSRLLASVGKGDVLVVVGLDRLARSVSHLLEVIAHLDARRPASRGCSPCWCAPPTIPGTISSGHSMLGGHGTNVHGRLHGCRALSNG